MSERILLTGGSGFVGANLARRLVADGQQVHLLLRPGFRDWRIRDLLPYTQVHQGSLEDAGRLEQIATQVKPDRVFHLAVHGAYSDQRDAVRILQTNLIGTVNLLHACAHANTGVFINTGSSSEYGPKDHAPLEDEPIDPDSAYAAGKAAATLYCRYFARKHDMSVPTLRLYSVFGPWEEPARLMPSLLKRALQNSWPPLASPDNAHDFVYVEDVVDAYIQVAGAAFSPGDAVYNVGTGIQTTLRQLVELIRHQFHVSAEPVWNSMPGRSWDTAVWIANAGRIRNQIGWKPSYTLIDGLKKMALWVAGEFAR